MKSCRPQRKLYVPAAVNFTVKVDPGSIKPEFEVSAGVCSRSADGDAHIGGFSTKGDAVRGTHAVVDKRDDIPAMTVHLGLDKAHTIRVNFYGITFL